MPESPPPVSSSNEKKTGAKRIEATYYYTDANGALLFRKDKYRYDGGDKDFLIAYYDKEGREIKIEYSQNSEGKRVKTASVDGRSVPVPIMPKILYRLPELAGASLVYIVEGEKDVETLRKYAVTATTSGGAKSIWAEQHTESLTGKDVIIIPDNDESGWAYAARVTNALKDAAKSVRVVDLAAVVPKLKEKGDITDALNMMKAGENQTAEEKRAELVRQLPGIAEKQEKEKAAIQKTDGGGAGRRSNSRGNYTADGAGRQAPIIKPLNAADVNVRPLKWFWDNIFIQGELNTVQALQKVGKSFLLCAISAACSRGEMIQGLAYNEARTALPCGNVLYLSGDDAPDRLIERLSILGADLSRITFMSEDDSPVIGSSQLEAYFEHCAPTLAILDTLQHFIPECNSNEMAQTTRALVPLRKLARKYNTCVVVIQHISKIAASGNGGASINFGLGSSAINGLFRSVCTLGRVKDESGKPTSVRALCTSGNNYVEFEPPAVLFELKNGFRWAGVDFDLLAEDLYAPAPRRSAGRPLSMPRINAEFLLQTELAAGPRLAKELLELAKNQDINEHALRRAKDDLKIETFQQGRQWFWGKKETVEIPTDWVSGGEKDVPLLPGAPE
jgi:5S rRNA maturation endonuclease (ribonuclease M5)